MDTSEKNFEEAIERALLAGGPDVPPAVAGAVREAGAAYGEFAPGGYHKRASADYDKALCLIPADVLAFLYATQPKEWAKYQQQQGADAKGKLLQRLAHEVQTRGTLDVLRVGIKANGCTFKLAYFHPASGLNETLQTLYAANIFSVLRQLHYSAKNTRDSLDVVIFLNGLPLFTAELKNPFTAQTYKHAIEQYRKDRSPTEPLFLLGRCLAHFAVDPDEVAVATQLEGPKTRFLPFNQGRNGGAGNPPSWQGFATAYLWQQVWARDSVLNLVQQFIQYIEEEDDKGQKTGKRRVIFPRYHQLDTVRRLVADAKSVGPGKRYLIQHSAGSGKSNSIAWLAHQLSILHNAENRRVFDSIIVITDRRVLDHQLQRTVRQFEQTQGVVENIDKTSNQLKTALEQGKTIIVTTLQKFPMIANEMGALPGKQFAVIIDEAHSSQTGESTKSLKSVLRVPTLEEAEAEDQDDENDLEDRIVEEMRKRGPMPNVSFFAFTATPKQKTLELFGSKRDDGKYDAFSLYSMRQAIEEGFILDVLANYTTYKAYWSLLKTIKDDPRYDRAKANYLLTAFVSVDERTIEKNVIIMVEHFVNQVEHQINHKAKAMIVTRSRKHAVRYKRVLDRYLKERGYPYRALVAFSGTVEDVGLSYTEASMNGCAESQTAETFKQPEYRFLIVANKFQTGFDQPLLHTMYVDKKLSGVHAVQTLSRLNRVHPEKQGTMVLDFANEADTIEKAFTPYYERTHLRESTDPNLLYDYQTHLWSFHFYTDEEVNRFAAIRFAPGATQDKLHAALVPVVDRYKAADEQEQLEFHGKLVNYVRLYAFLSHILPFVDGDLEKLYVFGRFLLRKLPVLRDRLPVEIYQNIDIESYRVQQTSKGKITLPRGTGELEPIGPKDGYLLPLVELEMLSKIIRDLNEQFGTDFSDEDKLCIHEIEVRLAENIALAASIRANTPENARLTFDHVVNDLLQEMIDAHFKFYKQVNDDEAFARTFLDWLFERYYQKKQREGVPIQPLAQPG